MITVIISIILSYLAVINGHIGFVGLLLIDSTILCWWLVYRCFIADRWSFEPDTIFFIRSVSIGFMSNSLWIWLYAHGNEFIAASHLWLRNLFLAPIFLSFLPVLMLIPETISNLMSRKSRRY